MSARPKISHYLTHQDTGQRYAVGDEVIIGRGDGDIIFTNDSKLSSRHCRLIRSPQGLGIHDLGSSNGTYVDGVRLDADRVYAFRAGSVLSIGNQVFELQEAQVKRKPAKRRARKKARADYDAITIMAGVSVLCAGLFFTHLLLDNNKPQESKVALLSPMQLVEKEMQAALNEYKELGQAHSAGEISEKGMSLNIRKFLLPRLMAVHEKLGVLVPVSEFDKRKLAANRKLVLALQEQVAALANFVDTKNPKYSAESERLSQVATAAADEVRKLEASRTPANFKY